VNTVTVKKQTPLYICIKFIIGKHPPNQ